jgi:phosphopantothenoylcysteine decarboxylase/phosphopantothenate--cysteine ligase
MFLANKRILLGVTGSIAAYKSADLVRRLREAGAVVRVIMTENAKRFITPLTMQAVSGYPVHDELFDVHAEAAMGHIELARWADAVLIAPATADCMARLANGNADDLLTTICVATSAPIALAPAMNQGMWKHRMTQENLQVLQQQKGMHIFGPTDGSQACGDVGLGRMLEPADLLEKMNTLFSTGTMAGLRVLVTAGPTHEAIDPVRYMTNGSTGKMGFALAEAAREAGADVTIVSGPVHLSKPTQMKYIPVVSAQEMYEEVMKYASKSDILLAVAAVGDYRVDTIAPQKIHKVEDVMQLTLLKNPDIVASVGQLPERPFIVGFAAETENVIQQAKAKRLRKKMNVIVANHVGKELGMGSDDNAVVVIGEESEISLPATTKRKLARQLIAVIANEYKLR